MGTKLNETDLALYRAIDEVLHYVWDPIGVAANPETRDEYQRYLPRVFDLVANGANQSAIADYLESVVTERIGMPSNAAYSMKIAELLLRWKIFVDQRAGMMPTR